MAEFSSPTELLHNRGLVSDPEGFAGETGAASWLFLCGEGFAEMDGGMAYESVEAAVPESANVVSDPPRELDLDLAREQIAALDQLQRAEADDALFSQSDELKTWVAQGLEELS